MAASSSGSSSSSPRPRIGGGAPLSLSLSIGDLSPTATTIGSLLEDSATATYVLFVLFLLTLIFAVRRFLLLFFPKREFDTPRLFVASIVFILLVRTLSFLTLAVMAFANVQIKSGGGGSGGGNSPQSNEHFVQLVLATLFNVGDWATISTYLLLVVLWVEFLATARRHWYSHTAIRRDWMIAYLVIVSLIYTAQIALYIALFTSSGGVTDSIFSAIYAVIAFLNLGVPTLLLVSWLAYAIMYAGFPYRSAKRKQSWLRLSRLVALWTLGRVLWAAAAILLANEWAVSALGGLGEAVFTVVTVTIFLLCELLPIIASLGTEVLVLFGLQQPGSGAAAQSALGSPSGPHHRAASSASEVYSVDDGPEQAGRDYDSAVAALGGKDDEDGLDLVVGAEEGEGVPGSGFAGPASFATGGGPGGGSGGGGGMRYEAPQLAGLFTANSAAGGPTRGAGAGAQPRPAASSAGTTSFGKQYGGGGGGGMAREGVASPPRPMPELSLYRELSILGMMAQGRSHVSPAPQPRRSTNPLLLGVPSPSPPDADDAAGAAAAAGAAEHGVPGATDGGWGLSRLVGSLWSYLGGGDGSEVGGIVDGAAARRGVADAGPGLGGPSPSGGEEAGASYDFLDSPASRMQSFVSVAGDDGFPDDGQR